MYLSGRSASWAVMAAAESSESTRVPSAARPPARCRRANASTSATVEVTSPAGPTERISPHVGLGTCSPSTSMWPTAAECRSASSGSVTVLASPSGVNSRSRIAWSQVVPVSFSITRPRSEKPELQYDHVAPRGWFWAASASTSTYFSRQSSPRPVSVKTSPSMPLVWVSRCRMVTLLVTSGSESRSSGTTSTTGVSSSTRPSSTSWRTTVAVQTLVIGADLEQRRRGRRGSRRQVERAVRRLDELVLATGRVAQDAELGAGDVVPLRQRREAVLPVPGVDPGAAAADGVLLDPVEDPAVEVEPLRRRSEQDEHVGGVRVEHQLGRDTELAQRGVPLLGLADRAGEVGGAVDDERGRPHVGDLGQRRHRGVPGRALPRRAAELVGREEVAVVAGAAHADQVADDSAGHRRREPVVVAGQVAGHEAAVAVAGDRQPLRVGEPLGDELVDGLEEVVGVRDAPRAVHRVVELLAVAVAAARVDEQDRPAARGQLLVVEVDLVGRGVPGVVRAAVDVDQERQRARRARGRGPATPAPRCRR